MAHPDNRYIEALLSNNQALISEMYRRFCPFIVQHVVKNSGEEQDGQDIFQEGMVAIYQRACRGGFELTVNFETYLFAVCRNLWLMQLRKKSHQKVTFSESLQLNIEDETAKTAEQTAHAWARQQLVAKQVAQLGDGCRRLLELSWSGKGLEEVARLLNNSYAYIRKKKSECMARLTSLVREDAAYSDLKW